MLASHTQLRVYFYIYPHYEHTEPIIYHYSSLSSSDVGTHIIKRELKIYKIREKCEFKHDYKSHIKISFLHHRDGKIFAVDVKLKTLNEFSRPFPFWFIDDLEFHKEKNRKKINLFKISRFSGMTFW